MFFFTFSMIFFTFSMIFFTFSMFFFIFSMIFFTFSMIFNVFLCFSFSQEYSRASKQRFPGILYAALPSVDSGARQRRSPGLFYFELPSRDSQVYSFPSPQAETPMSTMFKAKLSEFAVTLAYWCRKG